MSLALQSDRPNGEERRRPGGGRGKGQKADVAPDGRYTEPAPPPGAGEPGSYQFHPPGQDPDVQSGDRQKVGYPRIGKQPLQRWVETVSAAQEQSIHQRRPVPVQL
jgi:hypothetical protein